MSTATTTRNVCIKGEDGNLYIIPSTLEQKFISLKEAIIETYSGSDEWFAANDEFNTMFGSYEVA